jgi:hypothetical protein
MYEQSGLATTVRVDLGVLARGPVNVHGPDQRPARSAHVGAADCDDALWLETAIDRAAIKSTSFIEFSPREPDEEIAIISILACQSDVCAGVRQDTDCVSATGVG